MTILSLLLLQLLLERLQIPQKGLLKLEKTAVLQATFKGRYTQSAPVWTAQLGTRFSCISIFCYIAHSTKFTRGSSLLLEKSLLMEKSKAEESP